MLLHLYNEYATFVKAKITGINQLLAYSLPANGINSELKIG